MYVSTESLLILLLQMVDKTINNNNKSCSCEAMQTTKSKTCMPTFVSLISIFVVDPCHITVATFIIPVLSQYCGTESN